MNKVQILLLPMVLLSCGGGPTIRMPKKAAVEIRCYSGGTLVYEVEEAYGFSTYSYSDTIKWKEPGGIQMQSSADCMIKLVVPEVP